MARITDEELSKLTQEERYKLLSKKEQLYYNLMKSRAGVLFITSKPGLAKSSMSREIARIMGRNYIDIRLSIADETDFGMPKLKEMVIDGKTYDVHTMTVPEWAIDANSAPCIIHFEELNRCSLNVRIDAEVCCFLYTNSFKFSRIRFDFSFCSMSSKVSC